MRVCRAWPAPVRQQESTHGTRRVPTLVPSSPVPSDAQSPALTSMTLRTPQPSCGQLAAAACLRPCVQHHKPRSMRTRPGPHARFPLTARSAGRQSCVALHSRGQAGRRWLSKHSRQAPPVKPVCLLPHGMGAHGRRRAAHSSPNFSVGRGAAPSVLKFLARSPLLQHGGGTTLRSVRKPLHSHLVYPHMCTGPPPLYETSPSSPSALSSTGTATADMLSGQSAGSALLGGADPQAPCCHRCVLKAPSDR